MTNSNLTVGSLFTGIGGIDLGLERAGMRVIWQSEIDPYASRVLATHWPDVPNLGDITKIDWSTVERPDLICGGFPCQPFSTAGMRQGKDDDRYLWPEFARCLGELRPRIALLENVPGLLIRGMGDVLADLAALGFNAEWDCVPAAHVGAPHIRYRVFIVAYTDGERLEERRLPTEGREHLSDVTGSGRLGEGAVADTAGGRGQRGRTGPGTTEGWRPFRLPPRPSASDGWWAAEPELGRVAHGIPNRVDRLRCLGNAVVPQVAEYIGRLINAE